MKDEFVSWLKIMGVVLVLGLFVFGVISAFASDDETDGTYQDGYDAGYEAAKDDGTIAAASAQADIDIFLSNLTPDQWEELRHQYSGDNYLSDEKRREQNMDMYVYGYIKGYHTCQNGVQDEESSEYLEGWDYSSLQQEAAYLIGVN